MKNDLKLYPIFENILKEQLLSEIFPDLNLSENIKNIKIVKDNNREIIITFSTNKNNYVLEGIMDNFDSKVGDTTIKTIQQHNGNNPVYKVRFGTYKDNKIDARTTTNEDEQYLILGTVFHYLKEYIDKYDVRIIYFISEGEQRFNIYEYIIKKHFNDFYLFNEKDRVIGNISFMVKKEDYDRTTK